MALIHVKTADFDEKVLKSKQPVLVDFWASWCGPCRMLAPELEQLAAEHSEITVAKVNVDEEAELAGRFQISAIPAVMLFKDGRVAGSTVGYQPKASLEELLKQ